MEIRQCTDNATSVGDLNAKLSYQNPIKCLNIVNLNKQNFRTVMVFTSRNTNFSHFSRPCAVLFLRTLSLFTVGCANLFFIGSDLQM